MEEELMKTPGGEARIKNLERKIAEDMELKLEKIGVFQVAISA